MKKPSAKTRQSPEKALAQSRKEIETLERQAQVEAALERVRAKAMAMQQSDELADVIEQIYSEFQNLGFGAMASDRIIFEEGESAFDIWVSGTEGMEGFIALPIIDHPHHIGTLDAWKRGDPVRLTAFTLLEKLVP